jgi:hypothetical protein
MSSTAKPVAQQAEVLLRLVPRELVHERQRPAPTVEGVGVGRQHRHPALGLGAVDDALGDPQPRAE